MNEREAKREHLRATGHYARRIEEIKVKAAEIRKQGFRAVVVTVPDSPYSRGTIGVGYSVYCDERYFRNKTMNSLREWIATADDQREAAPAGAVNHTLPSEVGAREERAVAKGKQFIVTVSGVGSFPIDMLRYDRMTPRYEVDSGKIIKTFGRFGSRAERQEAHIGVELLADRMPTTARWASFLWKVDNVEEVR